MVQCYHGLSVAAQATNFPANVPSTCSCSCTTRTASIAMCVPTAQTVASPASKFTMDGRR